jgi:hypothetical protein
MKDIQKKLDAELKTRDSLFDMARLRRTVIKGLPCKFTEFKKKILPAKAKGTVDEEVFQTVGPEAGQKYINVRAKVWNIICRLDETKWR